MKRLLFLPLLLLCLPANGQALWRNFFTTNQNPIVEVVAGSNATVQASTVGVNLRRFTVNSTATGTGSAQTNISWTGVTNLQSAEMPFGVITNAPWQIGSASLTNLANDEGGSLTNLSATNLVGNLSLAGSNYLGTVVGTSVIANGLAAKTFIALGDSITAGTAIDGKAYPYWITNLNILPLAQVTNCAVSGYKLSDLWASFTNVINNKPTDGSLAVASVLIGANDVSTLPNSNTYAASLEEYYRSLKTNGFSVVALTTLNRGDTLGNDGSSYDRWNELINSSIYRSTNVDWIVDAFSLFPNPYNTNEFADGVHLTADAELTLAKLIADSINKPKGSRSGSLQTRESVLSLLGDATHSLISQFGSQQVQVSATKGSFDYLDSKTGANLTLRGGDDLSSLVISNNGVVWFSNGDDRFEKFGGGMKQFMYVISPSYIDAKTPELNIRSYDTLVAMTITNEGAIQFNQGNDYIKRWAGGMQASFKGVTPDYIDARTDPLHIRSQDTTESITVRNGGIVDVTGQLRASTTITGSNFIHSTWKWIDVLASGQSVASNPSGDPPVLTEVPGQNYFGYGYYFMDKSYFSVQGPHKLAMTNATNPQLYFQPHLHVSTTNVTAGTNASFALEMYYGPVHGYLTNYYASTNSATLTNTYGHYMINFGNVTNNALINRSSVVWRGRVMRVDGGDGDIGNSSPVWVDSIDIHVPVQEFGTIGQQGD